MQEVDGEVSLAPAVEEGGFVVLLTAAAVLFYCSSLPNADVIKIPLSGYEHHIS